MTRKAQQSVDGISVTNYKARFTGTVLLEDTEAQAAVLDDTLVMVIVGRVDDVQAKVDKNGDLNRISVTKVSDARLLEDDLRDLLVTRLGLVGADTMPLAAAQSSQPLTINPTMFPGQQTLFSTTTETSQADVETGEITPRTEARDILAGLDLSDIDVSETAQELAEKSVRASQEQAVEVVGSIHDRPRGAPVPNVASSRQEVADDVELGGSTTETLGRIQTKDPLVRSFLEADV